jgi:endonuclease/exonuclease/phosphatase family metal-dependent hydrolase
LPRFNLEDFGGTKPGARPALAERLALIRPQVVRLRADIVCFQEVNGQQRAGQPRALLALGELLADTRLAGAEVVSTRDADDAVFDVRNLVVVTALPVTTHQQIRNQLVHAPHYTRLTAKPPMPHRSRSPRNGPSCTCRSSCPTGNRCTWSTCI